MNNDYRYALGAGILAIAMVIGGFLEGGFSGFVWVIFAMLPASVAIETARHALLSAGERRERERNALEQRHHIRIHGPGPKSSREEEA